MVLFAPAAMDGSLPGLMLWASGTVRTTQVKPLSAETATPGLLTPFASMHFSFGNVGSSVRRNADMPVQTAAGAGGHGTIDATDCRKNVHGKAGPEGETAVIAPRAEGRHDVLRAVVDRVRIGVHRRRRHRVRATSYRLMVNACWLAGALRRQPAVTVVIGKG